MIFINLDNVEKLIFYDNKVKQLLPEFYQYFGQWKLAQSIPSLRSMGRKAVMDFINDTKEEHINILENYFGDKVIIDKVNYKIVENHVFNISEMEKKLNNRDDWFTNFNISRNDSQCYISFWR